jgi:hypothetical protein
VTARSQLRNDGFLVLCQEMEWQVEKFKELITILIGQRLTLPYDFNSACPAEHFSFRIRCEGRTDQMYEHTCVFRDAR